ncbi:hypothetical protein [Mesonia aestuariivivens]|uniref:Calcium-binding protein n=1 Tax=Mesonia aestuariivivens TaxID=2796128 RepID=A0ABS6W0S3_9FLAO|nr:hypothetical protein [Mesonia aestuariivivens]MBW2961354.1 hypothetical protein [Mesonia aestuariivivens]
MIKHIFFLLVITLFITSCDDGDVIVTNFDYDNETQLSYCAGALDTINLTNDIQIYNINNDSQEGIVLNFNRSGFTGTFNSVLNDNLAAIKLDTTITINLSNTNKIVYRKFNSEIPSDYYCQNIPPSSPGVSQEYVSVNGGSITFFTQVTKQDDNDGVPTLANAPEGYNGPYETTDPEDDNFDTDGDGIPNFLDVDDDNDNVPTSIEISDNIEGYRDPETGLPDTDQDGILNYLDGDDDGDGILTRNEDLNAFDNENVILNPTDDDSNSNGVPNYLDNNSTEELAINLYRNNIISRTFKTTVIVNNITLNNVNGNDQISIETLELGSFSISVSQNLKAN